MPAVFSVVAPSWCSYTLVSCWDTATHMYSISDHCLHCPSVTKAIAAPETSWELLAVDPDVSEALVVVALCGAGLNLCFDL
jgi:hypothetical protein